MNRKKLIITITAIALVVSLITGGLCLLFIREEDCPTPTHEKIDALRLTIPYETILDTDFSEFASGSLPSGWDKTFPYPFLENGNKTTSLETTTGNKSHVTIKGFGDQNYMSFCGRDGEHILTAPAIGNENYMITATVSFSSFRTPFGIVTDIPDDYKSAERATLLTLSSKDIDSNPEDDIETFAPAFTLSYRTKGDKDYTAADEQVTTILAADVDRSTVTLTNRDTGEGTIAPDTDILFKVIHFDDVSYFYMNDKLIGSMDDSNDSSSRFGFFSATEGREVKVKQLRIDTLKLGSKIVDETETLTATQDQDLTSLTELPEGYKLYSGQWLDKSSMGTAEAEADGVKITSSDGATALMLPVQPSKNYKFTATVKLGDGLVGLVTRVSDPLSGSRGGSFFTISDGKTLLYNLTVKTKSAQKEYLLADIPNLTLSDTAELTVYSLDGIGYFFINGIYITHLELIPSGKDTEFCGIYSEGSSGSVLTSVKTEMLIQKGTAEKFKISSTDISIDASGKVTVKTSAELSKNSVFGRYLAENDSVELGIIAAPSGRTPDEIKIDEQKLVAVTLGETEQTSTTYKISGEFALSSDNLSSYYTFRGYVLSEGKYYYGEPLAYSPAVEASSLYMELSDKEKAALDTLFKGIEGYIGKYEKTLTFTLFSDFHYKQGMYASTIADMQAILDRAKSSGSSFILSGGDFCNDFAGSPELMNCFLENNHNLPVYNVYGNHELEAGNSMQFVTPLLTNDKNVIWGTKDGKIGDGSIGYYYFDNETFRIICTDTNYSYNPTKGEWEHNLTGSYGYPEGNTRGNSLGPVQLEWLEEVLIDAAETGKSCIIIGHDSFAGKFRSTSPDASAVKELYSKVNSMRKGTVMLSINGHIHANNFALVDDVLYIDTNATRNVVWRGNAQEHYTDKHTFDYVEYDNNGNPVSTQKKSLNELTMGKNTWFTQDPLSAIVKISQYGKITVEGSESRWIYGIDPPNPHSDETPLISSGSWELLKK